MAYLLVVIYIAFIGLGVPDSLIGSAWPAVYSELSLPVEAVSCITLLISGSTVISGLVSTGVLNRFGTAKVTVVSTAMTAVSLLGFSFAPSLFVMLPLAVILGLGAGAIDAGLNNFVALHCKASHMNFLHCFYGIGVSLSPYLMSMALLKTGWRDGYRYAFLIQGAITLILLMSLPMWKKVKPANEEEETNPVNLSVKQMAKMPAVRAVWIIMLATNAIEYTCGTWGSTYLVNSRGFTPDFGAIGLTVFYAGMALGRFVSGLLSPVIKTWKRIGIGCVITALSVIMLSLPLADAFAFASLFFIGLGNGAIYPNFIHLTPHNFGKENSQAVMGSQIAFAYTGVMLAPPLAGFVNGVFGIGAYPMLLGVLTVIMIVSIGFFIGILKNQGKYHPEI